MKHRADRAVWLVLVCSAFGACTEALDPADAGADVAMVPEASTPPDAEADVASLDAEPMTDASIDAITDAAMDAPPGDTTPSTLSHRCAPVFDARSTGLPNSPFIPSLALVSDGWVAALGGHVARLDRMGNPRGPVIRLAPDADSVESDYTAVAADGDAFFALWTERVGSPTPRPQVMLGRFDASGTRLAAVPVLADERARPMALGRWSGGAFTVRRRLSTTNDSIVADTFDRSLVRNTIGNAHFQILPGPGHHGFAATTSGWLAGRYLQSTGLWLASSDWDLASADGPIATQVDTPQQARTAIFVVGGELRVLVSGSRRSDLHLVRERNPYRAERVALTTLAGEPTDGDRSFGEASAALSDVGLGVLFVTTNTSGPRQIAFALYSQEGVRRSAMVSLGTASETTDAVAIERAPDGAFGVLWRDGTYGARFGEVRCTAE